MRALLISLMAIGIAHAQFTQIAATDDGSRIYVTTPFVIDGIEGSLPGAALPTPFLVVQPRIFQIAGGTVTLFAKAPEMAGGSIVGAQVSADGSVVGYSLTNLCRDNVCSSQYTESYLMLPAAKDLGAGTLHLSRNGRWALLTTPNLFQANPGTATLVDLQSGTSTTLPAGDVSNGFAGADNWTVASDGSVLSGDAVWKAGQVTKLPNSTPHVWLTLSDDGTTAILLNRGASSQLIAHEVASGRETVIADFRTGGSVPSSTVSVSANGRYLLYSAVNFSLGVLSTTTFVGDAMTGQSYPLPLDERESMTVGVLNGPGTLAVIATSLGRLLRISLVEGKPSVVAPVVPQTLYLNSSSGVSLLAPGSLTRLSGSVTGTVDSLQGHILLDGLPLPILGVSGNAITAQVPWEVKPGAKAFQIDLPNDSPFHAATGSVIVTSGRPQFEIADNRAAIFGIKMIQEDFSGFAVNPLAAGAIVHTYMTGLGPVNGAVTTGVPASSTALNPIQWSVTCRFTPQASDAQTLFAGLAPGLIGIYQVDFKLADEGVPVQVNGLICRVSGPGFSGTLGVASPIAPAP